MAGKDTEQLKSDTTQYSTSRREEFNRIVEEIGVLFIKYPVSGVYPYLPFGTKMLRKLRDKLERLLEDANHEPILFPSLIPLSLFKREIDFFKGFAPEALVAKHTLSGILRGDERGELDEPLVLRPTSEVPIYYVYSQLINSWIQLPLKVYQTVNIYRIETKATAPFFRLREVPGFNEAHTFTKSTEEAQRIFNDAIELYSEFFKSWGIPFMIVESPPWDLFPGAVRNVDFITILPDGKLLELASVIDLGEKFAKAFEIRFQDIDGTTKFVKQVTYGVGLDRTLGALLWLTMDEKGLILHPDVTPTHVVIVPIFYSDEEMRQVQEYIKEKIVPALEELGLSYTVDMRDHTPGYKFYYWERRGIPLRLEIGIKEVREKSITLFRRDINKKTRMLLDRFISEATKILDDIKSNMSNLMSQKVNELLEQSVILEDVPLEKSVCERIEEEKDVNTIGKIIDVYGLKREIVGKVLFGRKY